MEQNKEMEMKKKVLESLIQNANKLMGDKMKGKPAAMVVDIKAAHPVEGKDMPHDNMMSHDPMDEEEMSEDPKEKLLEMLEPEEEGDLDDDMEHGDMPTPMDKPSLFGKDEEFEPSDELKHLIELHLMKRGKI